MNPDRHWVPEPRSGLLVPVKVPELTPEAAAERSWEVPDGGVFLEPKRPQYLPVLPSGYRFYIPWTGPPATGPFILPEV